MSKYPAWSPEEDSILFKVYPDGGVPECLRVLNRSDKAINVRASRLGIKLNNAWNKKISTQEYKTKLLNKGIDFEVVDDYINDRTEILHKCNICSIEWKVRPNNILNGSGCPNCNKGFGWADTVPPNKRAYLYILEFSSDDEKFIKVGITTNIVRRVNELKTQSAYNISILGYVYLYADKIILLEKTLLNYFKSNKYTPNKYFHGYTELLEYSCLNDIINILLDSQIEETL